MTTKQTWIIEGENTMHCAGCVQTVKFSLSQIDGVKQVDADYHTQEIEVEVSASDTHEQIVTELKHLGYQVRRVEDD
ncbi:MAG: heavy metal-associated domain-containing protein [Anaerolineae bacterium]|nr:heavy metal-associated domain-containing protein [Anaerolineae bacterium]MDQ7036836.1 heavy metal-associated domain-containing protein [Anaerolineae bacterium]